MPATTSIRIQLKTIWAFLPLFLLATGRIWAQSATTTTLQASATTVTWPAKTTLTATVTSSGKAVTPGLVKFCNAASTSCQGLALIGQAQLNAAGTANFISVLPNGVHSVRAIFAGTKAAATSSSATVKITVQGTQPTATSVKASAASPYALTATVTGAGTKMPTVTVSFDDGSNGNLMLSSAVLSGAARVIGFTPTTWPGAGNVPGLMAVGDFNGDGLLDVAVASIDANVQGLFTVTILLNSGLGSNPVSTTIPLPSAFTNPTSIATGDLNNDGILDLVVGGGNSSEVLILQGSGNGSFSIVNSAPTQFAPDSIAIGDFNGDGNADLAVANQLSASISILLGNGQGGFTPASTPATGSFPYCVAVGDFNGDGKQDLAVANFFSTNVTVLLGNGDGTFTATAVSPATGTYPDWVVVGDFNGDGKQDLAVTNQFSKTVTILLGDGKGNFTATATSPATGTNPQSVAIGDFNGDGVEDLAVANTGDNTLTILLGKGDGTFPNTRLVPLPGATPYAATVADFNADGLGDVAVAGSANGTVILALDSSTTSATATATGVVVPGGGAHAVFASYPGNSNYSGSSSSGVSLAGTIIPTTISLSVSPLGNIAVGQVALLTATIQPTAVGLLQPTGQVLFFDGTTPLGSTGIIPGEPITFNYSPTTTGKHSISAQYAGDLNFMGSTSGAVNVNAIAPTASATKLTLSSASIAKGAILTMTASVTSGGNAVAAGAVTFGICPVGSCESPTPMYLATVQLNSKGIAVFKGALPVGVWDAYAFFNATNDVLTSGSGLVPVTVTGTLPTITTLSSVGTAGNYSLTANVAGAWPAPQGVVSFIDTSNKNLALATGALLPSVATFTSTSSSPTGSDPDWIATGDFNNDGKVDLAVANTTSNTVSIFLNGGNGKFTAAANAIPSSVQFSGPDCITVGDFNNDGILDLAVTNESNGTVTILLGAGNGTFTFKATSPIPMNALQMVAADFNGDGKLDLATTGYDNGLLEILLGNGDGTFAAQPAYLQIGGGPAGMVAGDFNHDGKADLAVADFSAQGIVLLLGNGDGTFTLSFVPIPGHPAYLAMADFNSDGRPDLAVTEYAESMVTVLLNQGEGNFTVMPATPVNIAPVVIVAADFNGDGIPDVAVGNNSTGVSVLLGANNGTFEFTQTVPLSDNTETYAVAAADFNGDGSPDLAVGDIVNSEVVTFLDTAVSTVSVTGFAVPGAGTHQVKAAFAANGTFAGSASAPVALAATTVPTSILVSPSPGWIVTPNTTVTLNVTVLPPAVDNYTLSGTVSLLNGTTFVGSATLSNGQASFSTIVSSGSSTFTVTYSGDTNFAVSTSKPVVINVAPPSNVVLSASAATVTVGTPVIFTASVTADNRMVTQGVVTFCDATQKVCENSAMLGTASLTASHTASLPLVLGIGTHSIKALFAATLSEAAASSSTVNVTVTGSYGTSTTLTDAVTSGTYTLTAAVAAKGVHGPTGSVSFVDQTSNKTLGSAALVAGSPVLGFTSAASPMVGANPQAVAVGDFNGDGNADLAVANATSNTISILLGNGDGTFTLKSSPAVGSDPPAIAVGDYNGDGIADLAVANFQSNNVTILLGKGDGTFTTGSTVSVGVAPISIAAADFNADGKLDLAVAADSSNTMTILLGNGDGTFSVNAAGPAAGLYQHQVAVGDFNEDGKPDLAVSNWSLGVVEIWLGNGDGTFLESATLPGGAGTIPVVIGDFNGDGKLDVAAGSGFNGTVNIALGNGNGTFGSSKTITVSAGNTVQAMAMGDFNHDGKADLAVVAAQPNEVILLLGNGNGTFTVQPTPLKTGLSPQAITAGDFNGDGQADLAVANDESNSISVLLNSSTTTASASLSGLTISGSGNQNVVAKYPSNGMFGASTSNVLSLPAN